MIISIPTYLILISCITSVFARNSVDYNCPAVRMGKYSEEVNITVEYKMESIIYFPPSTSKYPYRVLAYSEMAQRDYPVFIMVKQQREVTSWELPLLVESKSLSKPSSFLNTSRTLCHTDMELIAQQSYKDNEYFKQLSVSISTFSVSPVAVTLLVTDQVDFYIELNKTYTAIISPSSPKYFYYQYSKNDNDFEDTVILDVKSLDVTCFIVSIQNYECPVFDLNEDIKYDGEYETINTQGGIIIKKKEYPNGFFVIFVARPDNSDCERDIVLPNNRDKNITSLTSTSVITFTIKQNISPKEYVFAVLLTAAMILIFCGFFIIITGGFYLYETNWRNSQMQQLELRTVDNNRPTIEMPSRSNINVGSNSDVCNTEPIEAVASTSAINIDSNTARLEEIEEISTHINNSTDRQSLIPKLSTVSNFSTFGKINYKTTEANVPSIEEVDVLLKKSHLKLSDLATKNYKCLSSESNNFFCHVITVGIFYGTPVVQLVITHQRILNITGNLDMCYYNFLCAHPLMSFNDFNHIFSNLGYVFVGSLFISITAFRDKLLTHIDNFGIPKHYGLYYAMGAAVIMEGVLSACYHICPSQENYQFDTSFMYVIAVLCVVKLYQNRHPDINATAHVVFLLLSLATLIAAILVFENHRYFWAVFIIVYSGVCIFIALKIYYVNNIMRGYQLFKEMEKSDFRSFLEAMKPVKLARFCFLSVALTANLILAFMGFYFQTYDIMDFGTFLLAILMMNTFGYTCAYILFKLIYREPLSFQCILYIILCIISWSAAIHFFLKNSTQWTLTAAESRQKNTHCILHINFYDYHDIWHLFSATALFFSCMLLLTIDDKLIYTPHSDIYIF